MKCKKSNDCFQGQLRVNQRNFEEAFVDNPQAEEQDLMLYGLHNRNRALHGDIVAVRLKPRRMWIVSRAVFCN